MPLATSQKMIHLHGEDEEDLRVAGLANPQKRTLFFLLCDSDGEDIIKS